MPVTAQPGHVTRLSAVTFLLPEGLKTAGTGKGKEGSETMASDHAAALTVRDRWNGAEVTVTVQGEIDATAAALLALRTRDCHNDRGTSP